MSKTELQLVRERADEVVPDLVGLSLAVTRHQATYTFMATDPDIALLDAVQYLEGGPCLETVTQRDIATHAVEASALDPWPLFARAATDHGVGGTLAVPITVDDLPELGSLNLYAASEHAAEGQCDALVDLLGPWVRDAVRDADGMLPSRHPSEVPLSLRAQGAIHRALGQLAIHFGQDIASTHDRLDDAAARAGVTPHSLAAAVIGRHP